MPAAAHRTEKKNTQRPPSEFSPIGPRSRIRQEVQNAHPQPAPQRKPEPHNKT